ncbi:unnamed protein product [Symbiodinium sp. CCMP2592]|nr:unnamed protein product [Symbiodinium sp. CCMP2592]
MPALALCSALARSCSRLASKRAEFAATSVGEWHGINPACAERAACAANGTVEESAAQASWDAAEVPVGSGALAPGALCEVSVPPGSPLRPPRFRSFIFLMLGEDLGLGAQPPLQAQHAKRHGWGKVCCSWNPIHSRDPAYRHSTHFLEPALLPTPAAPAPKHLQSHMTPHQRRESGRAILQGGHIKVRSRLRSSSTTARTPPGDQIIQVCQSDQRLEWLHSFLATISIMKEPAVTGGLTASEQVTMWSNRIAVLGRIPWIFAPIAEAGCHLQRCYCYLAGHYRSKASSRGYWPFHALHREGQPLCRAQGHRSLLWHSHSPFPLPKDVGPA